MKVYLLYNCIVYFVSKGTILFCMDKTYDEKEIIEVKKSKLFIFILDNNFGEIEMLLNKQLTFNIKVKSRNCELFVLKKHDFLKLSVNYNEFIQKFLKKALNKYIKFIDTQNNRFNEMQDIQDGISGDQLDNQEDKQDLEMIDEIEEEEEYNIYDEKITSDDKEEINESEESGKDNDDKGDDMGSALNKSDCDSVTKKNMMFINKGFSKKSTKKSMVNLNLNDITNEGIGYI